jgi:hypothetical protein
MSEVIISRFVETTLKERTTVYSPLVEAIVNSIEAILETGRPDGRIIIKPIRSTQIAMDSDALPDITGFSVEDNGVGFTKKNRDSFDTVCTDYKLKLGGKGLGRFIFIKYYKKVRVSSTYRDNGKYRLRDFNLGLNKDIMENEHDQEVEASDTVTALYLEELRRDYYDKELDTIARKILERILVFFVNENFACPIITLQEENKIVVLNNLIGEHQEIQHVHSEQFLLKAPKSDIPYDFQTRIYKLVYPSTATSKICLSAHNRQVTETSLSKYIPEFKDEYFETINGVRRNYLVRVYVLGRYLDDNVSMERGTFNFPAEEGDMLFPFSQSIVEKEAARIAETVFKEDVQSRRQKKYHKVQKYVDELAPWNKTYVKDLDLATLPYDSDEQTIETALQQIKFRKENAAKSEIQKIIDDPKTEMSAKMNESIKLVQEAGSSDLTHYVVLRKIVLELLKKLLEKKDDGKYNKEAEIHKVIFPMKSSSDDTHYLDHNLWILDEKLNFTEHISSDKSMDKEGQDRPDLLIFNKRIAYRSGNETSNPITIFEFKQPQRDDFANQSAKEDPIEQIVRYTIDLKEHKYITLEGRNIHINDDTPVYGYVICDFTGKVKDWLFKVKNFTPMPDDLGYFGWFPNNRLYIEVLAWDKILKDAEQRNKIFFKKLGLI